MTLMRTSNHRTSRADFASRLLVLGMGCSTINVIAAAAGFVGTSYDSLADYVLLASGPAILYLAALAALVSGRARDLALFYRVWVSFVALVLMVALLHGVLRVVDENPWNDWRSLGNDLLVWSYFFAGALVGAGERNWRCLDRWLAFWFAVASALVAINWMHSRDSLQVAVLDRNAMVSTSAYHVWTLLYAWPYFLLTWREGSPLRRMVAIFGSVTYAVGALVFEKRLDTAQLLALPVLLLVIRLISQRRSLGIVGAVRSGTGLGIILAAGIVVASVLGIAGSFQSLYDATTQRFQQKGNMIETVVSNYRLSVEPRNLLAESSPLEILFGKGFGSRMTGWTGMTGIAHNGLVTVVLKGGVVLGFLWLLGWLRLGWGAVRNKDPYLNRYALPLLLTVIFNLGFGSIVQNAPLFLVASLWAGRCMARAESV